MIQNLSQLGPIIVLAFFTLGFLGIIYLAIQTFEFSGFTLFESILLISSPIMSYLIPLNYQNLLIFEQNNIYLGINLFGFLVPVFISLRILYRKRVNTLKTIIMTAIISFLSFELSFYLTNRGVFIANFYFIPLTASMLSILFNSKNLRKAAPLAYVSGSLGVLIGADVMRINEILSYSSPQPIGMIVGGAGVLDAIFLVGIFSIIIDSFLIFLNPECREIFKEQNFLF